MEVAGLLLTGGMSRRMGTDKARLVRLASPAPLASLAGGRHPVGSTSATLADCTAGLLQRVARVCLEIGPGVSGLPAIREEPVGSGPLVAVAAGGRALAAQGWYGPALVVATDLPLLSVGVLGWLAGHPATGSVVPVTVVPQPLCARWSAADLALAATLVEGGARSMGDLLAAAAPTLAGADETGGPGSAALADADTPDDAIRLGLHVPERSGPTAGPDPAGRR